ncbi:MAG: hypothetical protein A2350_20535 [Candidatus Raymondbacteria bacterium RifOxyB12_full_50_8]|nr:MAG: hypothetical protein A2350_20535 [Candidatus Raymondbacteria bacterium RifOxyB12_full_50_8]
MRVLMYGWEFPPHISGGLGTACFGLTQAMALQGQRITFVLPRTSSTGSSGSPVTLLGCDQVEAEYSRTPEEFLEKYLTIETVDSPLYPYVNQEEYTKYMEAFARGRKDREIASDIPEKTTSGEGEYGPNLLHEIRRYASVAGSIATKVQHDVLHAHDWLTIPAGIEARRASKRPLVVHIHSLEFDRSGDHVNQHVYDIERAGMEQADRIIAVSNFTKNKITRHYGINPDKITVVHNAVIKRARAHAAPAPIKCPVKTVLFLGRVTFQKGPDYFVEAAAKVLSLRKDVRFVVAGCGDMLHRMIERVTELRIGRYFPFTGFLRGNDVSRIFGKSDVYVMPSVSEPFGISPLEAIQHDVPVIVSRQSGISEAVGNIFKVNFWDVRELADRILALLTYKPLRDVMTGEAAVELNTITWEKAARRVGEVYYQLEKAG